MMTLLLIMTIRLHFYMHLSHRLFMKRSPCKLLLCQQKTH